MVNYTVITGGKPHPVHCLTGQVSKSKANEANDSITSSDAPKRVVANTDTLTRSCLAGNGQELIFSSKEEYRFRC